MGLARGIGGGGQCRLGLADIEAAEAAFNQCASGGDDFFVQSMIVAAQHDDAAMGDNDRVSECGIVNDAGRDAGQVLGLAYRETRFLPAAISGTSAPDDD